MRQSSSQKRRSSKATQSTKYEGFQVFKPLEACICHWWPSAAVPCTEVETIRPLVGFVTSGGFSSHHGGLAMTCSKHANRQPKKQIDRQHLAHTLTPGLFWARAWCWSWCRRGSEFGRSCQRSDRLRTPLRDRDDMAFISPRLMMLFSFLLP